MLAELLIKNYALIEDQRIEFGPGLNVLTGETGAGKSIILGALTLVLGERPDPTMIRTGAESVTVEARFENVQALAAECERLGIELEEGSLVLRRRADRAGKSTAHANDMSISVASLRRLGDLLVDLHGQHQHQLLLRTEVHLEILDAYAGLTAEREGFDAAYHELIEKRKELERLKGELAERRQRRELTEYQLKELAEAKVLPGELSELKQEQKLLTSAEKRCYLAIELEGLVSEREGSVIELLAATGKRLGELAGLDPSVKGYTEAITGAESVVGDLWRDLVRYRESIRFSPERLEEVNRRLFLVEKLEKKYRLQADELPGLEDRLRRELDSVELDESRCEELGRSVEQEQKSLIERAQSLSGKRRRAKSKLEKRVQTEFAALGLGRAQLVVEVSCPPDPDWPALKPSGFDAVEFRFSANPGEELQPLRKVASGGELSRIMLGLKSILSSAALVPTMVFDEIDVGIGGRIAEAVGRRLSVMSQNQHARQTHSGIRNQKPGIGISACGAGAPQVLCITHLAQIAKYARHHIVVTKSVRTGRTATSIRRIDGGDRVAELARMVAGASVTETSLAHAREMLNRVRTTGCQR